MAISGKHTELDIHQRLVVDALRDAVNNLGDYIEDNIEPGRRRSVALTKLEDFSMWAVKAAAVGDD